MAMKNEPFDCVENMHQGVMRFNNELEGESKKDQLAYWQQKHLEALKELQHVTEAQNSQQ